MASDAQSDSEVPFGAYWLERRLAVGGMSEVFLARPRQEDSPSKKVVIKRLLPELVEDEEVRQAFVLEAKLHAASRHANVVEFYEVGSYAGEPYIAMEHVRGIDLYRLLRRLSVDQRSLEPHIACHVAREVCAALAAVHALRDENGMLLGVVHRDVSPSNILLSQRGEVKLGDFGIARASRSSSERSSIALKGKHEYLAPEQVAGDAFDLRADIFALAAVLSEMLLGAPLFRGAGQLAVLLAVRDVRIEPLRELGPQLPEGLLAVLERALSKDPELRHASCAELTEALEPFVREPRSALQSELAALVSYAGDSVSAARRLEGAVLESRAISRQIQRTRSGEQVAGMADVVPGVVAASDARLLHDDPPAPSSRAPLSIGKKKTLPEAVVSCRIRTRKGEVRELGMPKLIELLATNQIGADVEVDLGDGFLPLARIPVLARYLRPTTATTSRMRGPGVPDYVAKLPSQSAADALAWIFHGRESGLLYAEGEPASQACVELYFRQGQLQFATSSEPSSLLGELLVARGVIEREELDLAVLVMHDYNGKLGDTLIALGLVDSVQVFQAIRAQGRDRVASLFSWPVGQLSFYRGVEPRYVELPLDLDVPTLLLAGLAAQRSDAIVAAEASLRADERLRLNPRRADLVRELLWPRPIPWVLDRCRGEARLGDLLSGPLPHEAPTSQPASRAGYSSKALLVAVEACLSLGVVERVDAG